MVRDVKTFRKFPKVITTEWLKKIGACTYGQNDFLVAFPSGQCEAGVESLKKLSKANIDWLALTLFGEDYKRIYNRKYDELATENSKLIETVNVTLYKLNNDSGLCLSDIKRDLHNKIYHKTKNDLAEYVWAILSKKIKPT